MAHKRSTRCGIACGLLAIISSTACFGAGVTVITHGWNSDANPGGWLDAMATQIANRTSNPSSVTRINVSVSRAYFLEPLEARVDSVSGPMPTDSSASDEIIIAVEWSDVDVMPHFTTQEVAAEVADLFFNPTIELAYVYFGGPLAERSIHLIGHSRGGSVVTEIARVLGESGVWVDHVTTLDPHPAQGLYTDAEVKLRENVIFADNYYRADLNPLDFNGQSVAFAKNFKLDESTLESGAYPHAHQNVHLWYHGTVDTTAGASDGTYTVPVAWFGGDNPGRFDSGFYFSRLIAGFDARPALGLHPLHGGASGQTGRYTSQRQGTQWANIDDIRVTSAPFGLIQIGDQMTVTYRFQDFDSGATIDWYLDSDTNPYNTPYATWIDGDTVAATGQNIGSGTLTRGTTGFTPGLYYLRAKITSNNGGHVRYAYAPGALNFAVSVTPTPTPAITTVSPNSLPGLPLPQTQLLTLTGTDFLPQSKLEFFDGTTTYPNRTPLYDSPTQLRYNIKVGNVSANWTVKVLNGSLASAPAAFTVTATPDATAPPAPANVTFAFAGGVNDDFYYVDWTNPTDASGLAKVWWKLGAPPTSPTDGVGFGLPDLKPLPVSTLTTNPQTLHLWLEDGAGNKDHNQRASILLFRDTGAPFIVTPPTNRTVIEGASAIFNSLAGGAAPLAYQWQKNGTNIAGANASSYVTPPVTLADSGAQFRVIVTNAFGAVTGAWATLTVNPANIITWNAGWGGDTNWFSAANWNPQTVPTSNDRVVINSGIVNVSSNSAFAVLDLNFGGITGTLNVAGTLNWVNGGINAEINVASGGVLNVVSNGLHGLGGTLKNEGAVIIQSPGFPLVSEEYTPGIAVTNLVGGVFELQGAVGVGNMYGVQGIAGVGSYGHTFPLFHNAGLVRVLAGNSNVTMTVSNFVNTGTVEVQSGTLNFSHGLTSSGNVYTAPGGVTDLGGGSSVFGSGAVFTGNGAVRLAGNLVGTLIGPNFRLDSGRTLTGTFTVAGTMNWVGGDLGSFADTVDVDLTVASSGVLNLSGECGVGGPLRNSGTVVVTGSGVVVGKNRPGVGITNLPSGVFALHDHSSIGTGGARCNYLVTPPVCFGGGSPVFHNAGVVRVFAGITNSIIGGGFVNAGAVQVQSGTLNFNNDYSQTAGSTILDGGSLSAGSPIYLNGGRLSGNGVVSAAVVNAAEVSPGGSPGTLTIVGSYTQTSAGTLKIEIGGLAPGTQFDRLIVTGNASLDGILNVTLTNGFLPAAGDSFAILTCASRSGQFASTNGLWLGNVKLSTVYAATSVTLNAAAIRPVFGPIGMLTNGQFRFRLVGEPDQLYSVQASSNLVNWITLLTTNIPSGILDFVDPDSSQLRQRFYRALAQ